MLHCDDFLSHPAAFECFAFKPPTKIRVIPPTCIVSVRIGIILHVGDNLCILWACFGIMGASASHTAQLNYLLYCMNKTFCNVYLH